MDRLHYAEALKLFTEGCQLENVDEDEVKIIKQAKEYFFGLGAAVA
jgi:hypothetical protein